MSAEATAEFGKWRGFFWPIHKSELRKFVPMLLMFFFISFNYNAFRVFKDALLVTAPDSGAEALPFIKVWAILPGALLITYLFTRLTNKHDRERVFYIMMSLFLAFFFIFTFCLYPFRDTLHPHAFADQLQALLPAGFKGLIALLRNWTFTLFYVMAELWGTAIMSVLFWGFANEVTTVPEARRYYGLLTLGANVAGIFAGHASIFCSAEYFFPFLHYGHTAWDQSILFLNCAILISGLITIFLFRWLNRRVITPEERKSAEPPQPKIRLSMRKNFSYLAQSRYLIYIALIVLTFNFAMNLIEVVWKNQVKDLYPNPSDYSAYMGRVMVFMEIIATLVSLFISGNVIRKFSWTTSAMIPVVIMMITGILFFTFAAFPGNTSIFGLTPLVLSVSFGALQNALSRASKYTLFDSTKEMAFIPLSKESKLKGKAAIDGVGSRLGKSGGAVIHQGMLMFFTTVAASTPYVGIIFVGVILIWMTSVISLGKQFDELVAQNAEIEIRDKPPLKSSLA